MAGRNNVYYKTLGNCNSAGGYIDTEYSYSIFRWVYQGYCNCGWSTKLQWSYIEDYNEVVNLLMTHATAPRWGLLAYSFSLRDASWAWEAADLALTERNVLSFLPAPDAQLVVKAYDTIIAFAINDIGGWAWRSGSDERLIVNDAVKACKQYGTSRLLVLFNTVSGTIIDNRFK